MRLPELQQIQEHLSLQTKIVTSTRCEFRLDYPPSDLQCLLLEAYALEVCRRGFKPQVTEEVAAKAGFISEWLCRRPRASLMLSGFPGNGKTTMARAVCNLIDYVGRFQDPMIKVWRWSADEIVKTAKNALTTRPGTFTEVKTAPFLLIDDLGTEPLELKDYGNVSAPMIDLLFYRYDKQLLTIVTTNENDKTLAERYGPRIADRMDEMFSRVAFRGGSFRNF